MDGMEKITQFIYFQQAGSLQLLPITMEITYGLECILMLLQGVDHFKKIQNAEGRELFLENDLASQCVQLWKRSFSTECKATIKGDAKVFVLEIGIEEMPPQDDVDASQQLKNLIIELVEKQRLSHDEVFACGTLRRLVIQILYWFLSTGFVLSSWRMKLRFGDLQFPRHFIRHQGNPTKAAEGFCHRYVVPVESLYNKADGHV
ncbi:hypothetical protein NE237_028083 [Protea cynaroides]|uniref:glycine--tRNA ligase n=1 Tax=Protea cynaroides TaxID=273540 RepID=A0A9Q0GQH9_9MAGN|nr:hypothetical protein NE237_028083 [Protea cynaroides]